MKLPVGKRGLLAAATLAGGVVYWRVRSNRQRADHEWLEEIDAATREGEAAARAAASHEPSV